GIMSSSILCGGLPLAVGWALSIKMKKTDQLVVVTFGDGGSNNGAFHESINFAALLKLPIIFLCENNQFALSVRVTRSTSVRDIATRAIGYGIPGIIVDGNDVLDIYDLIKDVSKDIREGKGPVLIEAKTFRVGPWSTTDRNIGYDKDEENIRWKAKDPINRYREQLLLLNLASQKEITSIENRAHHDTQDAIIYAEKADYPSEDALYEDLFSEN
ncbi:hypothetical protein LCGC14_1580900, partial [marine sediment metagenome]